MQNNNEVYVAVSSEIIAFLAFAVSIWNSWETRHHNRLGIMPKLQFHGNMGWDLKYVGVILTNDGVGPAIIKTIQIWIDGNKITARDGPTLLSTLGAIDLNQRWVSVEIPANDFVLRPQQEIHLLVADRELTPPNKRASFLLGLSKINIYVEYESVYGDTGTAALRDIKRSEL